MSPEFFEAMEESEKYQPHALIATLVVMFVIACIFLANFWLIVGMVAIMAVTAGIIWVSSRNMFHVDPMLLDDDDIL